MALIVQKFGGTSVKSPENRKAVLNHIIDAKAKGYDVVVVVSAMGRYGDPYATDTLIDLLKAQGGKVDPKKQDLVMSCGEVISAVVMAGYIEAKGIKAEAMTGFQSGILTTADFGNAEIIKIDPAPIKERIKEGKVVVVAGFQGRTANDEITTLGRGGSDTTAVALGGYLGAEFVEIYTDVPGIAVTDPRIIPEAAFISHISFDEVLTMAETGAKVIHPRAVKAAKDFGIPIRVKSTFDKSEGTLIGNKSSQLPVSGISLAKNSHIFKFTCDNEITDNEIKQIYALCDDDVFTNDKKESIVIINAHMLDDARNLLKKYDGKLEILENISGISVVFEDGEIAGNIVKKVGDLLREAGITPLGRKTRKDYCTFLVKDEEGEKGVRAIFDGFLNKLQ